jgi:hypothetical protein
MPINSKKKGNTFERKMAKELSERFAEHTGKTASFRRNIDSGSFFGGTNQKRMEDHDLDKAEFGDVVCPTSFRFSLECKHYKTAPTFSQMLSGSCKLLDEWIEKAEQDAENSGRLPCIIMKFNNVRESVMVKELPPGIKPVMLYGDYVIITLAEFLAQSTEWFFEVE